MLSNHSSPVIHYWAGRYKESAWLMGPRGYWKTKLRRWMPYALDKDVYACWTQKEEWDEDEYFKALDRIALEGQKPMWVAVPDAIGNRGLTLKRWEKYADRISRYKWPMTMVVQDGMTLGDIPSEVDMIFVGGTTEWKWRNLNQWFDAGKRVHVGRVNSLHRVWLCHDLGCESVDGTGWFRHGDDHNQLLRLESYFKRERPLETMELFN